MLEKMLEQNSYANKDIEQKEKERKYSLDISESNKAVKIEIELTQKEINEIQKLLEEENFSREIGFLKKYIKKEGFKKTVISPFIRDFHVIPSRKDNTCFVPAKSIPRLKNLLEIMPELVESEGGVISIIKHERQHCWSEALDVHKNRISGKNEENIKKFDTESLANQQKIIRAAEEKERKWNKDEIFSYLSQEFICVKILAGGAEILGQNDIIEKDAKKWLRTQYFFGGDNSSIKKFGDDKNDFLNEYLYYKNQNKTSEFYDLFLQKFRKVKEEVLEKYNQYIKENNISDFYGKEDRECEDLRVKIINRLNQEKII